MSAGDTDYQFNRPETDLGGITQPEVIGRGRVPQLIDDSLVTLTAERVNKTGSLEKLQKWRRADAPPFTIGGRPSLISDQRYSPGCCCWPKKAPPCFSPCSLNYSNPD